jgi:hypothetical protein
MSSGEGSFGLPSPRRRDTGASFAPVTTTPWLEDTGRKDQGHALWGKGSTPPTLDKDGPTIMDATAPAAGEVNGTYKTSNK